jgi:hypothetical protein
MIEYGQHVLPLVREGLKEWEQNEGIGERLEGDIRVAAESH